MLTALLDLPSVSLSELQSLPECPGIYFVIDKDCSVLYIGKADNLRRRWNKWHHRFDQAAENGAKVAWMQVSSKILLFDIEKALIQYFQPTANGTRYERKLRQPSSNKPSKSGVATGFLILRKQSGVSQQDVAQALGVTYQTVSDWERNKYLPHLTPGQMLRLCHLLNCSLEDLAQHFPDKAVAS